MTEKKLDKEAALLDQYLGWTTAYNDAVSAARNAIDWTDAKGVAAAFEKATQQWDSDLASRRAKLFADFGGKPKAADSKAEGKADSKDAGKGDSKGQAASAAPLTGPVSVLLDRLIDVKRSAAPVDPPKDKEKQDKSHDGDGDAGADELRMPVLAMDSMPLRHGGEGARSLFLGDSFPITLPGGADAGDCVIDVFLTTPVWLGEWSLTVRLACNRTGAT
jgi:hypothetical protein